MKLPRKERINASLFGFEPEYKIKDSSKFLELETIEIFEIRGCNGSGKSSTPKIMINSDPDAYLLSFKDICLTICPLFKTIIVGKYNKNVNTGGCDGISGNNSIIKHILLAIDTAKEFLSSNGVVYRILYEGIMTSTTNYGIINFLPQDIQLNILFMDTPLEKCMERILIRNGGNQKIKTDKIKNKFNQIRNQPVKLKASHPSINLFSVPNSSRGKEQLLERWIELNYVKI